LYRLEVALQGLAKALSRRACGVCWLLCDGGTIISSSSAHASLSLLLLLELKIQESEALLPLVGCLLSLPLFFGLLLLHLRLRLRSILIMYTALVP
jgi:hypothetical protein